MNSSTITLKCKLTGSDDLRRRTIPAPQGIADLRAAVSELFQVDLPFDLLWRDEDEDLVTIDSDADVLEAVRSSSQTSKAILRLEVRVHDSVVPPPSNSTSAAEAPPAEAPPAGGCDLRGFAQAIPGLAQALGPQLKGLIPQFEQHAEHFAQELEKNMPAFEARANEMARQFQDEFEKHAPAFEKHAEAMAKQFEKHAREFHEQMPEEFKHKAHGLCKFLKKAKKNKKKLHMKFVADCSLPDGTEVMPGETISKTWQVVNSGKEQWPVNTRLQHVGSDLFEGTEASEVPCLQPGEEAELSLQNMVTPREPGRYMSHWRLATSEGNKFGDRLWFDLTVLSQDGSEEVPPVVHLGIICDMTGQSPIVGCRYKKFMQDYDLCQEAFDALSDLEKEEFVLIDTPEDAARVAEQEAAEVARLQLAEEEACLAEEEARLAEEIAEEHPGIWCDMCSMSPLRGPRYTKQLRNDTYDACQGCYESFDEAQKAELTLFTKPVVEEPVVEEPVVEEPAVEEPVVLDCTDLSASCMADIEAAFQAETACLEEEARIATEEAAKQEQERIAAEEQARLAAEEEARLAAEEEAARVAAEEAARVAAEAEAARVAEAEAEEARLAAEAEAEEARLAEAAHLAAEALAEEARLAAEAEAAAKTKAEEMPVEWRQVTDALVNMGFSSSMAEDVTKNAEGDFDTALEAALSYVPPPPPPPPAAAIVATPREDWEDSWDYLLEELTEMGFEDTATNKKFVAANKGDLKSTVTALVSAERAGRQC
jgi:hypothetical protein